MKEERIIEGNRLICLFDMVDGGSIYTEKGLLNACKYHTSWDWVIPVVEKIEKLDYGFKMCRKVVEVYVDSSKEILIKTKEKNRFNSLWLAIVKLLEMRPELLGR